jgi:5-(carboxyamino)imidazole ribonucleotide synthase
MYKSWHIGILGGGQLAKLTALAAYKLGHRVSIFAQSKDEPACHVTANITLASFDDKEAILHFAKTVDVITLENEFIPFSVLKDLEDQCFPRPSFFKLFENKIIEKQTASRLGVTCVDYQVIANEDQLIEFVEKNNGGVLKVAKGGYDGHGNFVLSDVAEAKKAFSKVKGRDLLVEKKLNFKMEVSQLVVRNHTGVEFYPIVETIQQNQICHFTVVPAEISKEVARQVLRYSEKFVTQLDAIGLYCFEYFVTQTDEVLFNEMAPRPHNSGHMTIESSHTSQYENLVRAITQMPLGSVAAQSSNFYAMVNLLGSELSAKEDFCWEKFSDMSVYIYGKKTSRPGRKMGHVSAQDSDRSRLFKRLNEFKETFVI